MTKHYPFTIVALLLICSHWINASWLQLDVDVAWRGLKEEAPGEL